MQRMGYTKGRTTPFVSELEAFDKLFDGNLTTSNAEALDALFSALEKAHPGSRENARPPLRSHHCVGIGCFLYVISK